LTTRQLYFQPSAVFPAFGPTKEIDDAPLSMAIMLAVIVRTITWVPLACPLGVARVSGKVRAP
jgi:hypothetical protein